VRDYELVVLVSPDVGDEGFPGTVERVTKFIQDRGGQIKNVDQWGRRRLAYQIRRFTEGFYAVTHFSLEPSEVRSLEGNLDLAEDVLRHLVVRHEEAPPPPPRRASRIGQDALVASGQEPLASPEDSPLTPREEAVVAAGEEESVSLEGEAPVAAEAAPEPEWSPASKPDAPSGKEK
jgi:small subunit ribosomal protein S6